MLENKVVLHYESQNVRFTPLPYCNSFIFNRKSAHFCDDIAYHYWSFFAYKANSSGRSLLAQ